MKVLSRYKKINCIYSGHSMHQRDQKKETFVYIDDSRMRAKAAAAMPYPPMQPQPANKIRDRYRPHPKRRKS